jgi:hypothetical protein
MLSLIPATMVGLGLATPRPDLGIWRITATIAGPLMLLGAASAAASLILARRAQRRESPGGLLDGGNPLATARAVDMPDPVRRDERK